MKKCTAKTFMMKDKLREGEGDRKSVKATGRTKEEVRPEENTDVDKEAMTVGDFQRNRQSKSARYAHNLNRPRRVGRTTMGGQRRRKM